MNQQQCKGMLARYHSTLATREKFTEPGGRMKWEFCQGETRPCYLQTSHCGFIGSLGNVLTSSQNK